jgi:predicted amidohydrolase YtcJ
LALEAQSKGFQVATHAIGDEAISLVINTYERLYQAQPDAPRHRIKHLGLPNREHLRRIADLGLHVVTQPIFIKELGRNFRQSLDDAFLADCYPFRSMLDHGINVAFSTDAPVVKDLRPLACIAAAMDRTDMDGEVISPDEKIGLMEALECYTVGGARANSVEGKVGSLEVGKDADLLALNSALKTVYEISSVEIEQVWRVGKQV